MKAAQGREQRVRVLSPGFLSAVHRSRILDRASRRLVDFTKLRKTLRYQAHQRASQGRQGQLEESLQRYQRGYLQLLYQGLRLQKTHFRFGLLPLGHSREEKIRCYRLEYLIQVDELRSASNERAQPRVLAHPCACPAVVPPSSYQGQPYSRHLARPCRPVRFGVQRLCMPSWTARHTEWWRRQRRHRPQGPQSLHGGTSVER